jgi:hypothetical protein
LALIALYEGTFDTKSGKSDSIVFGFVQFFFISGYPGLYCGRKYHQIASIGGRIGCRIGLYYLVMEKLPFFLEVRDPSLLTDPHLTGKNSSLDPDWDPDTWLTHSVDS